MRGAKVVTPLNPSIPQDERDGAGSKAESGRAVIDDAGYTTAGRRGEAATRAGLVSVCDGLPSGWPFRLPGCLAPTGSRAGVGRPDVSRSVGLRHQRDVDRLFPGFLTGEEADGALGVR